MNYKSYFAIAKKLQSEQGIEVDRKELVRQYTNGTQDSLRSLSITQYNGFVKWLQESLKTPINDPEFKSNNNANLMRRKIIALFRKMGYELNDKADMPRIYSWVMKYGYLSQPLNKYSDKELPRLVSQAEKVYNSFVKGL